jgi:hypothetical protein
MFLQIYLKKAIFLFEKTILFLKIAVKLKIDNYKNYFIYEYNKEIYKTKNL